MDKPLSFSGYKRYSTCPKMYEFNDIDKIPAGRETSALVFGKLIDNVVNAELLGATPTMYENLYEHIATILAEQQPMDFFVDDFDQDLVDMKNAEEFARELGWKGDKLVDAVKDMLKNQDSLSDSQYILLFNLCWESLTRKAEAMLVSFEKWILPHIAEVHEVQQHLKTDKFHGYLDFTCTLRDGRKVLFDLKTSKQAYKVDAVSTSPQLALYASMANYEYAGFIVLCKTLNKNKKKTCPKCGHSILGTNISKCNARIDNKRCNTPWVIDMAPTSYSQMLVDKVPQANKDLITDAMSDTIKCIDAGNFPRNLNQCQWMYGKPCPYIKKCWKGDKK